MYSLYAVLAILLFVKIMMQTFPCVAPNISHPSLELRANVAIKQKYHVEMNSYVKVVVDKISCFCFS